MSKNTLGYRIIVVKDEMDETSLAFDIGIVSYSDDSPLQCALIDTSEPQESLEDLERLYKEDYPEAFDHSPLWGGDRFPEKFLMPVATTSIEDQKLGRYNLSEFIQPLKDFKGSFFMKCPKCAKHHFRHAGYFIEIVPVEESKEGGKIVDANREVMVCVSCWSAYVLTKGKIVDVTSDVDMTAWKKLELKSHEMTGPGGQC